MNSQPGDPAAASAVVLLAQPAAPRGRSAVLRRWSALPALLLACAVLALASLWTLAAEDELSLGRKPWQNLGKTLAEMSEPSFLRVWFGNPNLQVRDGEGRVLRSEDQRATEVRNLHAPSVLAWGAKGALDVLRSIHTLVFGLFFVGIVGLGATAGILAVAAHSAGTLGKLLAEAIESLDMQPVDAVRATGATPGQVFFLGVWPAVLPQFVSQALYVWEFNIRDSTILGLVGAGGLGLLLSEAMSLFQWGRLATLLLAIVLTVTAFDSLSRAVRRRIV